MAEYDLILGGCGFIGRHVAVLSARAGRDVVLANRVPPTFTFPADVASRIFWQPFELASANWDALLENAVVVHHYAWTSIPSSANSHPIADLNSNVSATLSMLEALRRRGDGRIVFSSSGGTVYGKLQQIPVPENHPLVPTTAYGVGKTAAELYLGLYRSLHNIDCRIARISNPFGIGQSVTRGQGAATTFLYQALMNQPITIWGDGEVIRDYVHITDVAAALFEIAHAPRSKEFHVFNVGSGHGVSLNDIIFELEIQLKRRLDVRREHSRPFDIPVSILDISQARKVLGWSPQLSFCDGMIRTMKDIANRAEISALKNAWAMSSRA